MSNLPFFSRVRVPQFSILPLRALAKKSGTTVLFAYLQCGLRLAVFVCMGVHVFMFIRLRVDSIFQGWRPLQRPSGQCRTTSIYAATRIFSVMIWIRSNLEADQSLWPEVFLLVVLII